MPHESLPKTREKVKILHGLPRSTAKPLQDSLSVHQKMKAENDYKKGLWTQEEDLILLEYIKVHGKGQWNRIRKVTGLRRCGKSCRLRWLNYLSPNVKHGDFSEEEEDLIIRLHNLLGNRWSLIAGRVPGRTDNQVKNHWNTHLRKKLGIKKSKKEVESSSTSHLYHTEYSVRLPDNTNSEHLLNTEKVVDQESGETSNQEAELINQQYHNESLLFPTDYNLNLYSPGSLEFLEGYPLDLVWQNN